MNVARPASTVKPPTAWSSTAWPVFSRSEIVFSLKTFAAAMLAMLIANHAGLPRPFWALMTVYIVSNPLAGATRSKGLYRLLGTILGSGAALVLVPALSNAPELLVLALGSWTAMCLFVSLMDRTPRSYVFLLAGYTAAVIGFPSVQVPTQMFDTAVARVEEIAVAILCATAVHSLVFPTGLGPTILALLDRTLLSTRRWIDDLVTTTGGAPRDPSLSVDRSRVAGDLTQLRLLSTHIPFDVTHLRWTSGAVRAMQDRVAALMPTLSAVDDRLVALRDAEGSLRPDVADVLARTSRWLSDPKVAEPARLAALRPAIRALGDEAADAGIDARLSPWSRSLRLSLSVRLEELVDGWLECATLRADVDAGLTGRVVARHVARLGNRVLHRDYGIAALSAFAALVAVCLCSAFWIGTGWAAGAGAALMAAVFCSFFATLDDPVPAIYNFLRFTLWSVPISAVFVLVLLPLVHDFGMLVVVCAPAFLVIGCYIGRPATVGSAMPVLFGVAGALALYDTSSADLASFLNSETAQVVGIACAGLVTALIRSVGADWTARRIRRAIWRELAAMASGARPVDAGNAFSVRMLDRIGLLASRIPAGDRQGSMADIEEESLADLRIGSDITRLREARDTGGSAASAFDDVLADLAGTFRRRAAHPDREPSADRPDGLLDRIDRALGEALGLPQGSNERRSTVTALVGLRRNLFAEAAAPSFQPGAPS